MWYIYILETKDGQFYTGITDNIQRRMQEHKEGKGARFTRIYGFKPGLPGTCNVTRNPDSPQYPQNPVSDSS